MLIVLVDGIGIIGGVLGLIVFFVGLILYIVMSGKTNYENVGVGMGFTILGFVCMLISALCAIYQIIKGKTKKEKIIGVIQLLIIIGWAIFGYNVPAYSQNLMISYSKIVSIFVTPLWGYIILLLFNAIIGLKEKGIFTSIFFVIAMVAIFVMLGTAIIGLNYVFDNKSFLNWADTNYHYYNKRMITYRIERYKTDDFETIAKENLKNVKEELLEDDYIMEEIKEAFLNNARSSNRGYFEYELVDYYEESPDIYVCEFIDPYQYTDDNEIPCYYCKIDFSDFTVVEVLNYFYNVSEEAADYAKSGLNSFYSALFYAVERCKAENEPITEKTLNNHIDEVDGTRYSCAEVEKTSSGRLKITMKRSTDGEARVSNNASVYYVDEDEYEIYYTE